MIKRDDVRQLLGATGFVESVPVGRPIFPSAEAWIAWHHNEQGKIVEVLVTDDHEVEWLRANDFDSTGGACHRAWMRPVGRRDVPDMGEPDQIYDPAGTFGMMIAAGFATRGALREALKQFAKMEECNWARRMLFAVDGEWDEPDLVRPA